MKERLEEFIANLLSIGFSKQVMSEKAYEFALTLQSEQRQQGDILIPAKTMENAAELVKNALPGAYRLFELRNRMR